MGNGTQVQWESGFKDIEQLVAGARDFVVPTDELRPKVVESARQLDLQSQQWSKLRNLVICAIGIWITVLTTMWFLQGNRKEMVGPSAAQVEQMSLDYATQNRYGPDWGKVDVFWQLRGGDSRSTSPSQSTGRFSEQIESPER